jgi:hypothetical protein
MIDAVNAHARTTGGRTEYPTMFGDAGGPGARSAAAGSPRAAAGGASLPPRSPANPGLSPRSEATADWYGWQREPWSVGALEVWYWSMRPADRARAGANPWLEFLEGRNAGYPEASLQRDLDSIPRKLAIIRADRTRPDQRLADNMLDSNPAATDALVRLMFGALVPSREGGLLNARLRYFDPVRRRAGVPDDVAALVSGLTDRRTVVTLVNLHPTERRAVIVQAGAYAEHHFESAERDGRTTTLNARDFTLDLAPGAGATLSLATRRYVNAPTAAFPWDRR